VPPSDVSRSETGDVEIHRLDGLDAQRDVAAAAAVFDFAPHPSHTRRFLERDGHVLFVAYEDGDAVGMVSGVEMTHPDKGTEMFLYELGVSEEHQGRGIGTALVSALRVAAEERGCYGMWVLTEVDNAAARATYEAAGAGMPETEVMLSWDFRTAPGTEPRARTDVDRLDERESRHTGNDVNYLWRGEISDAELVALVESYGGDAVPGWWDQIRPFSLGWVTARLSSGEAVGFVNVAWDGRDHAFLLDTKTRRDRQHQGIGTELVRLATAEAKRAGCEWLHVDYVDELIPFYERACGFRVSRAGLINLFAR
jgi:ribosomal protein S18 acetylase RimI-like enzyme